MMSLFPDPKHTVEIMKNPAIYLDNAATTSMDPLVAEAMQSAGREFFGNASSLHSVGTMAHEVLQQSRERLARLVGASPAEIIFTGSGTESNNLALKGVAFANSHKGRHIVVSAIEHDCILKTARWLERQNFLVTYLPVDQHGLIDMPALEKAVTEKTILVSVMHANNEIGTIEPVYQIGKLCRERNVYFHSDACQSFGKIPVDAGSMHADLITINAHKLHGPKGVGALFIRSGVVVEPLLHGGGQENGIRSSTENIPGIIGFVRAAEIACSELDTEMQRITGLQERIVSTLKRNIDGVYFNGSLTSRLPHNVNFCIEGMEGEGIRLQLLLDEVGVCVSIGSACSSNDGGNPSHVLRAIGLDAFQSRGGIRLSLGRFTTQKEIDLFLDVISEKVKQLNPIF
ncbi:MAG: cysteine desulfurase family protein [Bacteroidetes bacterium]|nr:cysteine desulfurase family protein [Bacteroidota bacterium]